ncbi:MAG: sugar ABC transporter substrate-binding protein [Anaerolineales bacterium]|jgi:ribose transport system substrate-binding protein|nr:sugar ABC transporter substrate-binding protein [Anaerolineales bacterium]
MKKSLSILLAILVIAVFALSACANQPAATEAVETAPTEAPDAAAMAAEDLAAEIPWAEAQPGAPFDIQGKKVCYLIPSLANTFLNDVATSVKAQATADGVEVMVYGADDGGVTLQFNQIENCISQKVDFIYLMAAGSAESLIPAVEQAKKAGILVMGVPPGELEPFDAIMHTNQYEDGTLVVQMACDFINAKYPDAEKVDVAVAGSENQERQMWLRYQGYRTIEDCAKANVVQYLEITGDSIPVGASTAENILAAHPEVKVFILQSTAHAQGASQTIKALPNVDFSEYGVFAGDMDPTVIPLVTSCEDPYKGFVAIGGTDLDKNTYAIIKAMLQGEKYPRITNDALEPIHCDWSTLK